ncbi:MAG: hypothetical protein ACE147_20670, partial [Candidatus Methylomirabilales bacterium]
MTSRTVCAATLFVVLAVGGWQVGAAQTLPRIQGAISMDQAVNLGLEHSRRVKVSAADQRAMRSMQREALSGFFPQVSLNGYWVNQNMTPNIYNS